MDLRWLWLNAIISKDGPAEPYMRLVLMAGLWTFMDSDAGCYPSTRLISERTACTRKTVERYLRLAEKAGWIEIIERTRSEGQGWRRHKYVGKIPSNVEYQLPNVRGEGGVPDTPPCDNNVEYPTPNVEYPTPKRGVRRTPEHTNNKPKNQPIDNIPGKFSVDAKKQQSTAKKKSAPSPIALELSQLLLDSILSHHAGFKRPNLASWAKHIELMLRRDGRSPEDVRAVIEWSQADSFWHKNILSTKTLREKFDRLYLQKEDSKHGTFQRGGRPRAGANKGPEAPAGKYQGIGIKLAND